METHMKNILLLAESFTLAETNILSALILPKSIFITNGCKFMVVIIIYICVFIHKINKLSINILYSLLDRVSYPISPYF